MFMMNKRLSWKPRIKAATVYLSTV